MCEHGQKERVPVCLVQLNDCISRCLKSGFSLFYKHRRTSSIHFHIYKQSGLRNRPRLTWVIHDYLVESGKGPIWTNGKYETLLSEVSSMHCQKFIRFDKSVGYGPFLDLISDTKVQLRWGATYPTS